MRVLLIGYGLAGSVFHAPLIAATPGLELAGIVTNRNAQNAHSSFPGAKIYTDVNSAWSDRFDLAVVATPNDSHASLAQQALQHMPVVVDKPLASSSSQAQSLVEASRRSGRWLTVFQNRRWDSDFLTLQSLRPQLGDIYRMESRYERWRPTLKPGWRLSGTPEAAGGVLFDLGAHLIDQAICLFGPVAQIYAEVLRRHPDVEVDDDTFVALQHMSGVHSHLWMSSSSAHVGPRLRVLGSRGAYLKTGLDCQENQLKAGMVADDPQFGVEAQSSWGSLVIGDQQQTVASVRGNYLAFYHQVVSALHGQAAPPVDPQDSVQVLKVIECAFQSAREGQLVRCDFNS